MTKDEFEQAWPQLKEKLGVFFDDFKQKFEIKYKEMLQKHRPRLEKIISKMGDSSITVDSVINDLETKALIWNTKEKFIKEFREDVLDQVPESRQDICKLLILDLEKLFILNNKPLLKHSIITMTAGSMTTIIGLVLAECGAILVALVGVLAGLGAVIAGAIGTVIGDKSGRINNKIGRSMDKEYKNKNNEMSKLNGKNFFRVVHYDQSVGSGAGKKFKIVYGLDPQFKIKGVYLD